MGKQIEGKWFYSSKSKAKGRLITTVIILEPILRFNLSIAESVIWRFIMRAAAEIANDNPAAKKATSAVIW